jgi:excisionase family DNA binding protein
LGELVTKNKPVSTPPCLHTLEHAAERLSCCKRTLIRSIDRGALRAVKLGRHWNVSEAEVRRVVAEGLPH